jgi:hypothetical protein
MLRTSHKDDCLPVEKLLALGGQFDRTRLCLLIAGKADIRIGGQNVRF